MAASRWDSVPATNPKSVHLPPAKTNVAIAKNTSPCALRCRFLAIRDAQMPLLDSLDGNHPGVR
jgi:hypothetical protein